MKKYLIIFTLFEKFKKKKIILFSFFFNIHFYLYKIWIIMYFYFYTKCLLFNLKILVSSKFRCIKSLLFMKLNLFNLYFNIFRKFQIGA
jgi:hypothetical protein